MWKCTETDYKPARNQSQQIPEKQNHVGPAGRLQKETNNNNKMNFLHVEM